MSVSSVSLSSDANVRYQRLAQEYTKLRAQAKVLREGVIEERGKVDKLTEELKSKEAVIRRIQAENESLTFRNDQLVRRVENFQFEPPTTPAASKSHSSKKSTTPTQSDAATAAAARIDLLEQELRLKLEQNERLVGELAENERQHAVEMAEMSEKLAKEMRKLEDEVKRMRMRTKAAAVAVAVKPLEDELEKIEEKKEELVISSPEPPESQEEARIMVAEAARGTFSALTNVFSLLQQRCEIYPYDVTMERLPPHVEKLSSEYAQTARLFSNLIEITDTILANSIFEPDQQIPQITSKCRLISQHCHQMLTDLVRQMTGEENRVTWCTAPLSKLNNQWEVLMLRMFEVFTRVTEGLEASEPEILLKSLDELDSSTTEILDCFQKRWVFESRLPTTTRRMRCVGSALEAALQIMSQETSKLAARARRTHLMELEKIVSTVEVLPELEKAPKKVEEPSNNPFFDDDGEEDFKDAPELPEPKTVPEVVEEAPKTHDHLKSELHLLESRNEELQKERDRLFVDNSLVKRKLEIAMAVAQVDAPATPDMDQIWSIGMERRDDWLQRVQRAEKALRFYEIEFEILLRHEQASEEHLKQVLDELESVSKQNHRLEDELESVRRGYESQLGDLSEHLATLVKDREKDKETSKSRGSLKSFFNKS